MLRMISLVLLGCSSIALAQVPSSQPAPAEPAAPVQSAPLAELAPVEDVPAEDVAPEEPKMKKVCRQVEVVGSAIGRSVCIMKPIRAPKPPKA